MTPLDEIASAITSNPGSTDRELARTLKTTPRRVAAVRASLGIPPHRPAKTADANLWIRVPQATRTAVEALASAEGVTMSAWCAAAIVERMERVQGRMARLVSFKVGDRVRWVGEEDEWRQHWGIVGIVGSVTQTYGASGAHVLWDNHEDRQETWRVPVANLAPETDYIGSP